MEWKILGPSEYRKSVKYVLCECSCGVKKYVVAANVTRGISKSCGHGKGKLLSELKKGKPSLRYPDGLGLILQVFRRVKRQAEDRGYKFELSLEDYKNIVLKPCNYCKLPPSNKAAHSKGVSVLNVSGVDRLDNTIGYTLNNCVPCCKNCNRAKSNLKMSDFAAWINRLKENFNDN